MSDIFDRKVGYVMDYNQPKNIQLLNLSTQLDNINLGQLPSNA